MAPDADKKNRLATTTASLSDDKRQQHSPALVLDHQLEEEQLECFLQPRILDDFSYIEQPVRGALHSNNGKRLTCNGKSAVYLADDATDEFALLPQPDGSLLIRNTKTQQFVCCSESGSVYAARKCCEDFGKWTLTTAAATGSSDGYYITISSLVSQRILSCSGSSAVSTVAPDSHNKKMHASSSWKLELTSGELCLLSLPSLDRRVRCNLVGELSLSKNYQGWEAWRFSETGDNSGTVRISPWAHSDLLLASNEEGQVCCEKEAGSSSSSNSTIWNVVRAPNGLHGVLIKAVLPNNATRVLQYNAETECFSTIPETALLLDESCVWDLESLHRQIYYVTTADNSQRLEGAKRGLTTRRFPGRMVSEEWKIEKTTTTQQRGTVRLFSMARQEYLVSNDEGQVSLVPERQQDGSDQWVLEEREDGIAIRSHASQRILVAPEKKGGQLSTVASGTIVMGQCRWKLDPKIPRRVNKEKLQAVGGAIAVGVVGTIATPFLISGAIGAIGIAHVGVAGEVTIASIRAAEAVNTVTRVGLSSSDLMTSRQSLTSSSALFCSSSFLSSTTTTTTAASDDGENDSCSDDQPNRLKNRPFCEWRSW